MVSQIDPQKFAFDSFNIYLESNKRFNTKLLSRKFSISTKPWRGTAFHKSLKEQKKNKITQIKSVANVIWSSREFSELRTFERERTIKLKQLSHLDLPKLIEEVEKTYQDREARPIIGKLIGVFTSDKGSVKWDTLRDYIHGQRYIEKSLDSIVAQQLKALVTEKLEDETLIKKHSSLLEKISKRFIQYVYQHIDEHTDSTTNPNEEWVDEEDKIIALLKIQKNHTRSRFFLLRLYLTLFASYLNYTVEQLSQEYSKDSPEVRNDVFSFVQCIFKHQVTEQNKGTMFRVYESVLFENSDNVIFRTDKRIKERKLSSALESVLSYRPARKQEIAKFEDAHVLPYGTYFAIQDRVIQTAFAEIMKASISKEWLKFKERKPLSQEIIKDIITLVEDSAIDQSFYKHVFQFGKEEEEFSGTYQIDMYRAIANIYPVMCYLFGQTEFISKKVNMIDQLSENSKEVQNLIDGIVEEVMADGSVGVVVEEKFKEYIKKVLTRSCGDSKQPNSYSGMANSHDTLDQITCVMIMQIFQSVMQLDYLEARQTDPSDEEGTYSFLVKSAIKEMNEPFPLLFV